MKKHYKQLTPEEARSWLIRRDKEGIDVWMVAPDEDVIEAVGENLRDFGDDDDEVYRTPKTASIGFIREDGDVQLLATHNNSDELISPEAFMELIANTVALYQRHGYGVMAWYREDAVDYIDHALLNDTAGFVEILVKRD